MVLSTGADNGHDRILKLLPEHVPGQTSWLYLTLAWFCAPGLKTSISFTGASLAQPGALRLRYQLVSPLHRAATEYRHEVTKKWENSAVNGSSY